MALIKDENISKAQNYFLGYMDAKKDMKEKVNKAIAQLEEEKKEFAYADFKEYNEEVLGYDDTDICERDLCHIGLARAIEILKRNLGDD